MPHYSSQQPRFVRTIVSFVLCTIICVGFLAAYPTDGEAFEPTEEEKDYTVEYVHKLLDEFGYGPEEITDTVAQKLLTRLYPNQTEFIGTYFELFSMFETIDKIADAP